MKPKKDLAVPPAAPVRWTVTRRKGGAKLGTVVSQTWFGACRKAMIEFGVESNEIFVVLENGAAGR